MSSTKVAVVSSDGQNIDLHFGQAKDFLIYELKDGAFVLSEKRELPAAGVSGTVNASGTAGGAGNNGGEAGSSALGTDVSGSGCGGGYGEFSGGCGGFGGGCGSGFGGGCGGSGGGCGSSGSSGPLAPAVELLQDVRAVVAAQIGQNIRRQFERNAISVFDIELPVSQALSKLAAYYLKFD